MVKPTHRSVFQAHALGIPNTGCRCYHVTTNRGSAYFATGRYSQHTDPRIITITRMLYPDRHASHFLAAFRRWLRTHTKYTAAATHTDPTHDGTHLKADGWVYVSNHNGRRRWIRTL